MLNAVSDLPYIEQTDIEPDAVPQPWDALSAVRDYLRSLGMTPTRKTPNYSDLEEWSSRTDYNSPTRLDGHLANMFDSIYGPQVYLDVGPFGNRVQVFCFAKTEERLRRFDVAVQALLKAGAT